MADLDAIRQAIEERDAAVRDTELLATEMVYKGNSVQWWHSKATAYKTALGYAWDALIEAGINPDGKIDVAEGIRLLAAKSSPKKEPTMAKCIICRQREAVLRDRENPTSNRKKVCRECHAERLAGDLRRVIAGAAPHDGAHAHGRHLASSVPKSGTP